MQTVMMKSAFSPHRILLGASLVMLLSGCALPRPGSSAQPVALNAITLTPADLKKAEKEAFDQGFEAGRVYERKHTADSSAHTPADAPVAASPIPATCTPPATAYRPPSLPPLPPSASYTSSGPAKPLQQQ